MYDSFLMHGNNKCNQVFRKFFVIIFFWNQIREGWRVWASCANEIAGSEQAMLLYFYKCDFMWCFNTSFPEDFRIAKSPFGLGTPKECVSNLLEKLTRLNRLAMTGIP